MGENKKFSDIFRVKNVINALVGFIETKVELYKIQFKEESAKAMSIVAMVFIFTMIGLLFIMFLSHFLSSMLNEVLESDHVGYLIVASIYLIIGIIVYLRRKHITNAFINMMFTDEEIENNQENEQQ